MRSQIKFKSVEEYLSFQPEDVQYRLEDLRDTIKAAAPQAVELISYNIPAYRLSGMLVYFAAYKSHIGFYPTSSGVREFKSELSKYKVSKGAIQFPIGEALPLALIAKIVKFRAKENEMKMQGRGKVPGSRSERDAKAGVNSKVGVKAKVPAKGAVKAGGAVRAKRAVKAEGAVRAKGAVKTKGAVKKQGVVKAKARTKLGKTR